MVCTDFSLFAESRFSILHNLHNLLNPLPICRLREGEVIISSEQILANVHSCELLNDIHGGFIKDKTIPRLGRRRVARPSFLSRWPIFSGLSYGPSPRIPRRRFASFAISEGVNIFPFLPAECQERFEDDRSGFV
jgi:hypothetical protein